MAGPTVRTDIVDCYVFRRVAGAAGPGSVELLQLRRTARPLAGTWQPVMGHVEAGESAAQCVRRELEEEVGLVRADGAIRGAWALEQVHPFFLPELDCVVMSPRFAVEVGASWEPRLNEEHGAARWVHSADAGLMFLWPGQRAAIAELLSLLREPERMERSRLA